MLSENRKLVYADGRYNDSTLLCAYLKSILLFQDFFLRFLTVCAFLSWFLFGLVFLFCASLHIMKSRKKTTLNITIYAPVEQKHYCVEVFTDHHVKER